MNASITLAERAAETRMLYRYLSIIHRKLRSNYRNIDKRWMAARRYGAEQRTMDVCAHLLGLSGTFSDPLPGFRPGLIESQKTSLSTTLDELVRLCDELCVVNPGGDLAIRGDSIGLRIPGDLSHSSSRVLEVGLDLRVRRNCRCTLEPIREQELGVVFADGCMSIGVSICAYTERLRTNLWRTWWREERKVRRLRVALGGLRRKLRDPGPD